MLAFPQAARLVAHETVYPFENMGVWWKRHIAVRISALFRRASNAARVAQLERDIARLQVDLEELDKLAAENERLRSLLEYPPRNSMRWQSAPVLSRGGTARAWRSIRVGKGSLHGVRPGDPVIAPPANIVGRVSEVFPKDSDVMLLVDPNIRIAAELELPAGAAPAQGILVGGGVQNADNPELRFLYTVKPLRLRYLDQSAEETPADGEAQPRARVVTSGLGKVFPKGLMIGWLLESHMDGNGLSWEAEVEPAVDFTALTDVFLPKRDGGER